MEERADARPDALGEGLRGQAIAVHFEGVKALDGVDIHVRHGEILGLIGPNGAGKTTLINVFSGFQRPTGGTVSLDDHDVTRWSPEKMARNGLVRTFQSVRLFAELTVFENVEVAALGVGLSGKQARIESRAILDRLGLGAFGELLAKALPHGQERLVGIARALVSRPQFVLLDEPVAGLNSGEGDDLLEALRALGGGQDFGLLIVEHDMRFVMELCGRIQVLDYGKTLAVGTPAEIRASPEVQRAYLGQAA